MNDKIGITTQQYEINHKLFEQNFTNTSLDSIDNLVKNSEDLDIKTVESIRNIIATQKTWCNLELVKITKNGIYLIIEFNPNKIKSKQPSDALSYTEFKESFEFVENELTKVGINLDINKQLIYKTHYSFDILPTKEYKEYYPIIATCLPVKSKVHKKNYEHQENSIYLENSTKQIICYDKKLESNLTNETIRFEIRNNKIDKSNRNTLHNLSESLYYKKRYDNKAIITKSFFSITESNENNSIFSMLHKLISEQQSVLNILKYYFALTFNKTLDTSNYNYTDIFKYRSSDRTQYRTNLALQSILTDYKILPEDTFGMYLELKELFSKVA